MQKSGGDSNSLILGLVANELVVNATKYAFAGNANPTLALTVCREGAHSLSITAADNGPGLPPRVTDERELGFGLTIASTLAAQHGGTVSFDNDGGAVVRVTLRLER